MKRISWMVLTTLLAGPGAGLAEFAYAEPAAASAVIDAGNTVCPVSGDKVSGKHFVEYQGKRYGLCCAHCEREFKKDPEKYIATLEGSGEHAHGGPSHEGHG